MKTAECSELGVNTLVMLYHCAKVSAGNILEVGSYVGEATITMAMGVAIQVRKRKSSASSEAARASSQRTTMKFYRSPLF